MVVSWVPRIISRVQEAAGCATADFPNVICNISQQQGSCIQSVYCLPTGFGCSLGAASQKLTQVMESALGKGSVPGHWKYTLQLQGPSAVLAFLAWGQKVCVHKATTRKWDLLLQVPQIYFRQFFFTSRQFAGRSQLPERGNIAENRRPKDPAWQKNKRTEKLKKEQCKAIRILDKQCNYYQTSLSIKVSLLFD